MPKKVYLFSGTILDNLRLANPYVTELDAMRAIELAGMGEELKNFNFGLHHQVIQNGANLSSGQRRKLAFARLFVCKPDAIFLDEASSALDISAEEEVFRNIRQYFPQQTIVSVAHRIYTVRAADSIVVLEKGKIAEQGNHDELVALNGLYRKFVSTYLEQQ